VPNPSRSNVLICRSTLSLGDIYFSVILLSARRRYRAIDRWSYVLLSHTEKKKKKKKKIRSNPLCDGGIVLRRLVGIDNPKNEAIVFGIGTSAAMAAGHGAHSTFGFATPSFSGANFFHFKAFWFVNCTRLDSGNVGAAIRWCASN